MRDGTPLAIVSLEWNRRSVGLDTDTTPVVGSRVDSQSDASGERRQQLQNALAVHREVTGGESNRHWTAVRHVLPDSEDPGSLHRFEARLAEELAAEWHATATHIDRILDHAAET